jgi:flagellar protein FliO/FliZ
MDVLDLGRYFGALILVMGLLGFAWLAARKYGVPGVMQGTVQKRLSIVETLMIGTRHKVYLLRRDGTEHLVMVGPQGMSVVENGIPSPAPVVKTELPSLHIAEAAI